MDLRPHERKVFSQNGEDGILEKIFESVYEDMRYLYYVELGCGNGTECNTRYLKEHHHWHGLLVDAEHETNTVRKEMVTMENVVGVLQKYGVHNPY